LLNWYKFGVLVVDEILPGVGVVEDVVVRIVVVVIIVVSVL